MDIKLVGKAAFPQSVNSRDEYKMKMSEDEMGKKYKPCAHACLINPVKIWKTRKLTTKR